MIHTPYDADFYRNFEASESGIRQMIRDLQRMSAPVEDQVQGGGDVPAKFRVVEQYYSPIAAAAARLIGQLAGHVDDGADDPE